MQHTREGRFDILTPESESEARLSRFERAVCAALLDGSDVVQCAARAQLEVAAIISREFDGSGAYVRLRVPASAPKIEGRVIMLGLGKAAISVLGATIGAAGCLAVAEQLVQSLEVFTVDGRPWPFEEVWRCLSDREPRARINDRPVS